MRRLLLCTLALAALGVSPARAEGDARAVRKENQRLEAEVALAATPKPYFVLDLERQRIALRTRGMDLFDLPIAEQGVWGRRLPTGPTTVVRREALARPEIRPGEEKTPQTLDDQILELADMPTRYRFYLGGDVEVQVFSRVAGGGWPHWRQRATIWRWRLSRPLLTLRQRRERRETTTVFVVLEELDARRLYWSFFEGLDGIVVAPR